MLDELQCPPLPADLETANRELRYWQRSVVSAREQLAKCIEHRELDKRSLRGSLEALRTENVQLRKLLVEATEALNFLLVPHYPPSHPSGEEP